MIKFLKAPSPWPSIKRSRNPLPNMDSGCIQRLPNLSAARVSSHRGASFGAAHLSSPIGGAAKGRPLKLYMPSVSVETPCTGPCGVEIRACRTRAFLSDPPQAASIRAAPIVVIVIIRVLGDIDFK